MIRNTENYGYAEGNDIGASYSSPDAEYILFLNPDVIVDPNWLEPLVNCMKDEKVAVAQPKILMLSSKEKLDSAGHFIDLLMFTAQTGYGEIDRGQYDNKKEIFGANGAALIVRKQVFQGLKGFDRDFFMYFEESDFCWRVWLAGYQVLYIPNAVIYHYGSGISEVSEIKDKVLFYTSEIDTFQ